jgi:cytidylate kinase
MSTDAPPVVTISSLYGTNDTEIGRGVAERLGVGFLDREEIPKEVADRLGVSPSLRAPIDEKPKALTDRLASVFARAPVVAEPWAPERLDVELQRYRAEVERLLFDTAASGAVIVGRAGTVVLQSLSGALHVRLTGPRAARVRRVMQSQGVSEVEAERLIDAHDRARDTYGRQLYGVDPADVDLYHLLIDTIAFDVQTIVDLIVSTSNARRRIRTD